MSKQLTKYNFKEFKPVLAVSRRSLRKGQASLYDLLVSKLNTGEAVTADEAKEIWMTKVCKYSEDGVPHTWVWKYNHAKEKYESVYRRMTDEEILFNSLNWLTRTIGILVIRGYLKAIPMVRLV